MSVFVVYLAQSIVLKYITLTINMIDMSFPDNFLSIYNFKLGECLLFSVFVFFIHMAIQESIISPGLNIHHNIPFRGFSEE